MARNKKPLHLKILNGSAKHNPGRVRDMHLMPKPEALDTSAPTYFNEELTSIWDELIEIIPAGVAGQSDRITIELFCYIVHQVRTEPSINSSAMRLFVSFASRFGLTPVDRQNIEVPAKKVHNAFDSL